MSKTRKLSLNDFYKATPGATPLETLPSKPGETARINDVPYTDLGVSSKFSGGQKTYAGFSADLYNGSSRGYGGPLGYSGNAYENNNRNQVSYAAPRGDWGSAQHQYDHPPPQRYDQDNGRADRQFVQGVPREYGFMPAGTLGGYGGFGGSSMPPPPPPPPRQQQLQLSSAGAATPAAPEPEIVAPKPAAGPPRATKVQASELGRALANTAQLVDRPAPASQVQATSIPQRKGPEDLWEQASGKAMSQQSCSPKNEWAEKMAQAALSKLSTGGIKSSLLSSSPALGDAISHPTPGAAPLEQHLHTGAGSVLPPAAKPSDRPPTEAVLAQEQAEEQQRPRLNLLPRTKPALDTTDAVPAADAATAANGGARPKLNLLPRSKPATDNGDTGSHKPSIFGSARPREEVLKERGVDPALADLEAERHRQAQLHAALGVEHPRHSGPAFAASGFSEEPAGGDLWQTVGGGVRGGAKASLGQFDDMNPFFGGIGTGGHAGAARPVPSARAFGGSSYEYGQDIGGRNSHGNSYGSPACREGVQFGGFAHQEDDGPMFKRSLPTRQDFII